MSMRPRPEMELSAVIEVEAIAFGPRPALFEPMHSVIACKRASQQEADRSLKDQWHRSGRVVARPHDRRRGIGALDLNHPWPRRYRPLRQMHRSRLSRIPSESASSDFSIRSRRRASA